LGAVSTGRSSSDLGVVYYDPVLARRAAHGHLFLTVVSAIFTAGFAFVALAADAWLAWIVVVLGVVGIAVNLLAASSYSADKKETDWLAYELDSDGIRLPYPGATSWREIERVRVVDSQRRPRVDERTAKKCLDSAPAGCNYLVSE